VLRDLDDRVVPDHLYGRGAVEEVLRGFPQLARLAFMLLRGVDPLFGRGYCWLP
jgi:hypothetical protein